MSDVNGQWLSDGPTKAKLDKARVNIHDLVTGMFVREMLARNARLSQIDRMRKKNIPRRRHPTVRPRLDVDHDDDDLRYPFEEDVWLFFLGLDMSLGEEYSNPISYYSSKNMKYKQYRRGIKMGEHIKDEIKREKIKLEVRNKLRRNGETLK
jgi:hypothetical protein